MNTRKFPFIALLLWIPFVPVSKNAQAQKKLWQGRIDATRDFLQNHMYNPGTQNYVRRADAGNMPGSDAWGITIMLDADAYLVEEGLMKPDELKQYYIASSGLYEKTDGQYGARILAHQGAQIYIGGDDEMQWAAALVHCFFATKDSEYLKQAKFVFNALIDQSFWIDATSKGWAWNSNDRRPNGVSTAYGALATARLYQATGDNVYKQWATASIKCLSTQQVGFFPRDMMVAANAAHIIYEISHEQPYLDKQNALVEEALLQSHEIMAGKRPGELNPTDIGDLAEAYFMIGNKAEALKLINFFVGKRSDADVSANGFYSHYGIHGEQLKDGSYLGVPLTVQFLPEVAEMLKLFVVAYKYN